MKTIKISILLFVATLLFCFAASTDKKLRKNTINALNENYAFVPSGNLVYEKDTLSIQSFIMFKTEVSNFNYREFLTDLKKRGELEKFNIATIDSELWINPLGYGEKYTEYYHNHPAYRDYPVLNISKEGAELYCEWLSEKINEGLASDKKLVFRLPTHAEWMRAAQGGLENNPYPWKSPFLINSSGNVMCDFLSLDGTSIGRDSIGKLQVYPVPYRSTSNGNSDVTAPVKSYWPNGYDVYNMSGNVAEMVSDKAIVVGGSWQDPGYDVRIESQKPYVGAGRNSGFRMVATVVPAENEWLKVPKKKK